MKIPKKTSIAAFLGAAMLALAPTLRAALVEIDIAPTNSAPAIAGFTGTYTTGAGTTFTITSDGTGFFPPAVNFPTAGTAGDVLTMAAETITGDFDRCARITDILADTNNPAGYWQQGGITVRTGTNSYNASIRLVCANPTNSSGGEVMMGNRALDGENWSWVSRRYFKVSNSLPNQWIRLRRVGDWFAGYVSTNGASWSLIGQEYLPIFPATLIVGPYAASDTAGQIVTVHYASYGPTPSSDTTPPTLVSAGTLDKIDVGVKFSEPVSAATAKNAANYQITQTGGGTVTIQNVTMGIGADAVYLRVSGLTNDNFTVKVTGGVQDTAGNTIVGTPSVAAHALNWNHGDMGYIQDAQNRQKPGDDPARLGSAVMISSDENPEVEIVGGGSNSWNPGDFTHYIWRTQPLSGNFDVTVAVSRNDRPPNFAGGGWGNSGIMLRASFYNTNEIADLRYQTNLGATKTIMVENSTYQEGAGINGGPNRGSIPLWRTTQDGGYGNGNAGFGAYGHNLGGVIGYYQGLNTLDATGVPDPLSISNSARYLRIKRVGTQYTFYASWNRTTWAQVDSANLPTLPDQLLLGFATMNDTGGGTPPTSAYGNDGHNMPPYDFTGVVDTNNFNPVFSTDPYSPYSTNFMRFTTNADGTITSGSRGWPQNPDSLYSVQRIKIYPNGVSDPLPASLTELDLRDPNELSDNGGSTAMPGSWASTGTTSFTMTGGGFGQFNNLSAPYDGTIGGDEVSFAYETLTGDFDKQIEITSLTNTLYNYDHTAVDTNLLGRPDLFPETDPWLRAGLMVRTDTNAYNACLKILAANPAPAQNGTNGPAGANVVRVIGRGIDGQNYTVYGRDLPGVNANMPHQYLRVKRVGNSFTFYVSKDGVVWSLAAQCYQEFPSTVLFGPYCAASLRALDSTGSPADSVNNPDLLISQAQVSFTAYQDVINADPTAPTLVSAGTLDGQTVGVKFSKQVASATATVATNYTLSQGTVTSARIGIGGDTVYLTVTGLVTNSFTVTVSGVTDTFGDLIAANSSVPAKVSSLASADIGYIQSLQTNAPARVPVPGDDPYRIGQAVVVSSDDAPEVEIIGGGSNAWSPGDFLHYVYVPTPISGDFDVTAKVSRDDRPNNTAAWANSGIMLRNGLYNSGDLYTATGTQVPMVCNTTYIEASAPGRGAIPLWRNTVNGGYGNGNAGFGWGTLIGNIKGYFTGLNAIDASGNTDTNSSPYSARFVRINRTGTNYTFYASWDGVNWAVVDSKTSSDITIADPLYIGFSTMNDTGGGAPPFGGYAGDGHSIDPNDPLNWYHVQPSPLPPLVQPIQNESNYSVQKIRIYTSFSQIGAIRASRNGAQIQLNYSGTLVTATKLTGPWSVVNGASNPYNTTPSGTRYYRVIP